LVQLLLFHCAAISVTSRGGSVAKSVAAYNFEIWSTSSDVARGAPNMMTSNNTLRRDSSSSWIVPIFQS